jgi:membrane fusion protein (multidrug efflux system)
MAIIGVVAGIKALQFDAMATAGANQVMPPEPVTVIKVHQDEWRPRISAVGSIMPVQGTVVSAESEGVVRKIHFQPGAVVNEGDVLVDLDSDIERAQLRSAQANAELASLSFARAKELISNRTISREAYDQAHANVKQAEAEVDNINAVIAKKQVRAPFAGRLGIRRISVGQYLQKGSPIVALHSLDPVYADFSLPQQRLADLNAGLRVTVTSDAYPLSQFQGTVTAIDPDIDPSTRNVRVQAILSNADGKLRPGMFVAVDVEMARGEPVLTIPATAVVHAPFGNSIYIVEPAPDSTDGKPPLVIRQQRVELGHRRGDMVVATDGVAAGDTVVSTGVFKLRPGMPVTIDNTLAPDFRLEPNPDNT